MKDPGKLINNPALRLLVNRTKVYTARSLLRKGIISLLVPRSTVKQMEQKVKDYFQRYLELEPQECERLAHSFIWHYSSKFAEDTILLNLTMENTVQLTRTCFQFEGHHHLLQALESGAGILAVGSHVGAVSFGTVAFLSMFLDIPHDKWPRARICVEPEVERYPTVLERLQSTLAIYGGDVAFILSGRDSRTIATEIHGTLSTGNLVTTNIDVLMGGSSTLPFTLFDKAQVHLKALVGAAKSALRAGAIILPWRCIRLKKGFRFEVQQPFGPLPKRDVDIPENDDSFLSVCEHLRTILEQWIRDYPEQWIYWDRFDKRMIQTN